MAAKTIQRVTGVVQTSGAVTSTVVSVSFTVGGSAINALAMAKVTGRDTSNNDLFVAIVGGAFQFDGEGTSNIVGSSTNILAPITSAGLATASVAVDTDGASSIRVRATGIAAKTIEWFVELEVNEN